MNPSTTASHSDTERRPEGAERHLPTPRQMRETLPVLEGSAANISATRKAIRAILYHQDPRLLVIVGPCSIHDTEAAQEYGSWLREQQAAFADQLLLVMRAYVEKPRTRFGWNGLVNDPTLDGSGNIAAGLQTARKLLLDLQTAGIPAATEFVDVMTAFYLGDTVSWVAIGARTAESPIHRHLASGLPCPVGFKNGTDGSVRIAIDGVAVAQTGHCVIGLDASGRATTLRTSGNTACHVILRGGATPNYDARTVSETLDEIRRLGAPPRLLIDCSHGNATHPGGQVAAFEAVARHIRDGNPGVMGLMLESNLVAGHQSLDASGNLVYGRSITDPCLGLDDTAALLRDLARQPLRSA